MTREQFIERWRHELAGLMLDGGTEARTGACLGLWCRLILKRVDRTLAEMHDSLVPKPSLPVIPVKPEAPKGVAK